MVLSCTSCSIFSEFLRYFWAIYEFSWFYSIYFWILVETCSYESFEGFHARFEIFGFLYEQWSQIEVGIEKVGKILDSLKFGTADSPRVRGGQSAVHEIFSPEALQRSSQPQKYIADSPPKDRGRSACVGQYLPEAVSVGRRCENSKADGPLGYRGQSANGQKGRSWQLNLSWATKVYP